MTLPLVSCVKHCAFYGSSRSSVPESHYSISTEQNCSLKHRKPQSRYIVTSLVDIVTYTAGIEVSRSLFFLHDLQGSLAASLNRRINFVDISSRFMYVDICLFGFRMSFSCVDIQEKVVIFTCTGHEKWHSTSLIECHGAHNLP